MRYVVFLLLVIPFILSYAQTNQEHTVAELGWSKVCYRVYNVTASATVQLADPDMNKIKDAIDTVRVFVYSDSNPEGTQITLYETEHSSGVFEGTFGLSEKRSAPNILQVREGDTITAIYTDTTLPKPYSSEDELKIDSTAFIGCSSPPLERVPASAARIVDSHGNTIDEPALGEQIAITSDVANGQDREQKFTWLAQILDEKNKVVSLGWINGTLNEGSAFSPSMSWMPQSTGKYTAAMFVWESLDNPTALSPPISIEFMVGSEEQRITRYGPTEMFLFIVPQDSLQSVLGKEKLSRMHFYNIDSGDLLQLPRLGLLLNMTRDFADEPVKNLKLRISDDQLNQYGKFFEKRCTEERPYAGAGQCASTDYSFEFGGRWYYAYNETALSHPAIEDSHPGWDEDYFGKENEN